MRRTIPLLVLIALTLGLAGAADTPSSFRFTKASAEPPAVPAGATAPIQLTASDGTGLSLVALEVNGVLEPPLAFTELHLTFENPRDQTIEGRFRIGLPPGAALSRFAMKTGDAWQEGEVVERQRARQVYEDFLHRKQDPALLEQEAGNEFSARIFPIPARSRKELIVSYSHAMERADEPYVLPLQGLAEIGRLDIRVLLGERPAAGAPASNLGGEVSDRRMVELHKTGWTPDRDFRIGQDQVASRAGLRHDNLAVFRVSAPVETVPQEISGLYVLVDSSASRALGYADQTRRVAELIAGLRDGAGASTPVGVAAFDQEVVAIFEGAASGFGEAEARRLASRRPLGASDLNRALAWLGDRLDRSRGLYPRVLLVTDGVVTAGVAGETGTGTLKEAVRALKDHGVERLDVLAVGGLRDDAVLRELTTGNLPHDGQRLDGSAPLNEIARRLSLRSRSGIPVKVEGAAWVWPDTLDGVQPGDERLIYADLPKGKPLQLSLGGKRVALSELTTVERPLLERAWAQARIERLVHLRDVAPAGDEDMKQAMKLTITELSVKHRVLSPFTAMLVLETEWNYQRFGLDRKALSNILTVGAGGLEVLARRPVPSHVMDQAVAAPKAMPAPEAMPDEEMPADEVTDEDLEALQSLGYVGSGADAGVEGGVEGGVVGGVVGGVAGGTPGGVPSAAATQPVEVPAAPAPPPPPARVAEPGERARQEAPRPVVENERRAEEAKEDLIEPYTGRFAEVMKYLKEGRVAPACALAESWNAESPGDVLALLALGEAWEAAGEKADAARAYGSLIDLFPGRVDMRRLAGERLERLGEAGLDLAIDTYRKAAADRPDHPSGHRLLAWALLRAGQPEAAFEALEKGVGEDLPSGRYAGVDRILREDLGLLAAAWLRAEPGRRTEILDRLQAVGARLPEEPSLRFVLSWETDANDVDLHVWDRREGHAFYSQKALASGGELFADVTTGYGPECFAITRPSEKDAAPYRIGVHYYSRGPMGYGMGTVQVIRHDGKGGLQVEPRPFVVMVDRAMVDVGKVEVKR